MKIIILTGQFEFEVDSSHVPRVGELIQIDPGEVYQVKSVAYQVVLAAHRSASFSKVVVSVALVT